MRRQVDDCALSSVVAREIEDCEAKERWGGCSTSEEWLNSAVCVLESIYVKTPIPLVGL